MWTADHTCGRREAVDESGEQPEERPNRLVTVTGSERPQSFAEEAKGETGGRKKWEQGTTERKEINTLHVVFHFPDSNRKQYTGSSNGSGNRSNASAMMLTVATVMVDNEILYDICHRNVDFLSTDESVFKSAFDKNRRIDQIFGDCFNSSMTNIYVVDLSGEAILFDSLWAPYPSSGSGDSLQDVCDQETCSSYTSTSSCSSKLDSLYCISQSSFGLTGAWIVPMRAGAYLPPQVATMQMW